MVCLPEFKSGRAEVCTIDRITDTGPGQEHFVRLPDGYLLPCGTGKDASPRAKAVADLVNVVMRWAGSWPPLGNMSAVVEGNLIGELRWRASNGETIPNLTANANLSF